jgi:hypothetical protein
MVAEVPGTGKFRGHHTELDLRPSSLGPGADAAGRLGRGKRDIAIIDRCVSVRDSQVTARGASPNGDAIAMACSSRVALFRAAPLCPTLIASLGLLT